MHAHTHTHIHTYTADLPVVKRRVVVRWSVEDADVKTVLGGVATVIGVAAVQEVSPKDIISKVTSSLVALEDHRNVLRSAQRAAYQTQHECTANNSR